MRGPGEHIVELTGEGGATIRGILHLPAAPRVLPPVVMFSGWGGTRYGPNRILVETARLLACDGRPVLRADFRGRGDSDGAVEDHDLRTHITDGTTMVRWTRSHVVDLPPVLLGICSGGEVAVGCLFEAVDVDSVCLWSAPIFAAQATGDRVSAKRALYLKEYGRKLLRAETWRRLVAGEVRFDLVKRVLTEAGVHQKAGAEPEELSHHTSYPARCGAALMVYGTADPIAEEAIEAYEGLFGRAGCCTEVHRIRGANHGFYGLDWKREVIGITRNWLGSRAGP